MLSFGPGHFPSKNRYSHPVLEEIGKFTSSDKTKRLRAGNSIREQEEQEQEEGQQSSILPMVGPAAIFAS